MLNEIFRFVVVRSPKVSKTSTNPQAVLKILKNDDNTFRQEVKSAGLLDADKSKVFEKATLYLSNPDFLSDLSLLPIPLISFINWLDTKGSSVIGNDLNQNITAIFGSDLNALIKQEAFKKSKNRIALSLIIASIAGRDYQSLRPKLLHAYKVIILLESLTLNTSANINIKKLLDRPVIFPKEIFPVVFEDPEKKKQLEDTYKTQKEKREKTERELKGLSDDFSAYTKAVDDILKGYDKYLQEIRKKDTENVDSSTKIGKSREIDLNIYLSNETKLTLKKENIDATSIKPGQVITKLTEQKLEIHKTIQKLGRDLSDYQTDLSNASLTVGDSYCYPITKVTTPSSKTFVPQTKGKVHGIIIGELLKVRQDLVRYELGDIAHIENIMLGESKSKKHRQLLKTEEFTLDETETTNETEKDLQTQDQFELQSETSKTINKDKSADAGLTVTGSYGPIEYTATANGAISSSSQESKQTAANYARSITERSVQKIKERVFKQRKRTTIDELELINEHAIDNTKGTGHITGIYRWVNKIYKLQIVNYGIRHMLEFIIPEPAAFYRYAFERRPDESSMKKPEEPMACRNGKLQALKPYDITENNYLEWFGKYGIIEIAPPPKPVIIVTHGINQEGREIKIDATTDDDFKPHTEAIIQHLDTISLPENYRAKTATIRIHGRFEGGNPVDIIIGSVRKTYIFPSDPRALFDIALDNETGEIPLSIFVRYGITLGMTVEIECIREQSAYVEWQISAFNAIITAYNEQKSLFEREQLAREFRTGINIQGRNPFLNRDIEKTELKKQALSQLTGQRYEFFDAVLKNQLEYGYPETSFEDAYDEGRYIRFFENAFEWHNMTYLFYPYFWSNKGEWMKSLQIKDNDPLFEKFLQAGAARVQVPVRPGFEEVMLSYIQNGGAPWEGSEAPLVESAEDTFYISMLDELKAQFEVDFETAPGTISVETGSKIVTGFDTNFQSTDIDREMILNAQSHRIASVESPTAITLRVPYTGNKLNKAGYYLRIKFVGEAWEELVPTNLVYLKKEDTLL